MSACTFFGHRDCPSTIRPQLQATLIDLIEHHSVDTFYVGNQGGFDAMVYKTLKELKQTYPHIQYTVVLAYLPTETTAINTILPKLSSPKAWKKHPSASPSIGETAGCFKELSML